MTKPKRIQRKRVAKWKAPEGAVYVGRPTKWGNPFKHEVMGRAKAVSAYRRWLKGTIRDKEWAERFGINPMGILRMDLVARGVMERAPELRGKDLMCWCSLDQPCHADVLLEIANS